MPLDQQEILRRLTLVFRDVLDQDDLVLNRDTTARAVDGWDSLAHVRLMVATEAEFRIRLGTAEIESLKNVGDLVDSIASKVATSPTV